MWGCCLSPEQGRGARWEHSPWQPSDPRSSLGVALYFLAPYSSSSSFSVGGKNALEYFSLYVRVYFLKLILILNFIFNLGDIFLLLLRVHPKIPPD